MRQCRTFALVGVALLTATMLMALALPFTAEQAVAQQVTPQAFVDKFAPIAYLREQSEACDRRGSVYFPAPVEIVLGNPEVSLKQGLEGGNSATDPIVKMAPTAQDLVGLDDTYYLDFPGNPRRPECVFDADFRRFVDELGLEPTTYGRIFIDEANQKIVVQYWFWYYFNDWNNTHEGDWERIHLVFDASSIEEAFEQVPTVVGYAQHGGGELADWNEDKHSVEGTRSLVFPAVGAQATFFEQRLYLGWGENGTGFGCDDTTTPSRRTPLNVVLIPDEIDPAGPFAWLTFEGRWGERQPWEFNGPRGPNLGGRWSDPLASMENWRTFHLYIPESRFTSGGAAYVFCDLAEAGARIITRLGTSPKILMGLFISFLTMGLYLVWRNRRALREAFAMFRGHGKTFLAIGLLEIPIGMFFNIIIYLGNDSPPLGWIIQFFNDTATAHLFLAGVVGGLQYALMLLVVTPPVVEAIRRIQQNESVGFRECLRGGYRNLLPLVVSLLIVSTVVVSLWTTVFLIPLAIFLNVKWQFWPQAVVLDGARGGRSAISLSSRAVYHKWWDTAGLSLVFRSFAVLPGPIIGLLLLVLGRTSVQVTNVLSSIVLAFTVPIAVIGMTLVYERLRGRIELGETL